MRALIACEQSQIVTIMMRVKGVEAYSCDIDPCAGARPEWHIQGDALQAIARGGWDMIIAFPPCTHLANSGARWFAQKRRSGRQRAAVEFFMSIAGADCPRIAIENPMGVMSTLYRRPDQIIHPWEYGHREQKTTCLWLKGLPPLLPGVNVRAEMMQLPIRERARVHHMRPSEGRARARSRMYDGIALAMAEQWPLSAIYTRPHDNKKQARLPGF